LPKAARGGDSLVAVHACRGQTVRLELNVSLDLFAEILVTSIRLSEHIVVASGPSQPLISLGS
jgi:hypothetical protein